mmetsp:Transcript_35422/g.113181  ORF Transcript_35422/g.113181 Transcript_35422/m.113181 type:complete len:198 (+) Transcript_35422:743-1336(+)
MLTHAASIVGSLVEFGHLLPICGGLDGNQQVARRRRRNHAIVKCRSSKRIERFAETNTEKPATALELRHDELRRETGDTTLGAQGATDLLESTFLQDGRNVPFEHNAKGVVHFAEHWRRDQKGRRHRVVVMARLRPGNRLGDFSGFSGKTQRHDATATTFLDFDLVSSDSSTDESERRGSAEPSWMNLFRSSTSMLS